MLAKLHKDIDDYDVDYQYQVLIKVVEHEQEVAAIQKREKWYNIFRGVNGVSYSVQLRSQADVAAVPDHDFMLDVGRSTSSWTHLVLDLFILFLPAGRFE